MENFDLDTKRKLKVGKPTYWRVYCLNDDFTPFEVVEEILGKFFNKTGADARDIAMETHRNGRGLIGIYVREEAETRMANAMAFAKNNGGRHFRLKLEEE